LSGHTNYVSSLCFDGESLYSGSWDCSIFVWDIRTWQARTTWFKGGTPNSAGRPSFGHQAAVSSLVLAPDGKLISGSYDKSIKVWNRRTNDVEKTLEGHDNWIYSLGTIGDKDNYTVWSASRDKTVKKWDMRSFSCIGTYSDHTDNVTSLAVEPETEIVYSSSMDKSIKARDTKQGKCCQTMTGHTSNVFTLLCAYNTLYSGSWDKTIKIWQ
jgi:hypothetical protein